MAEDFVIEMLHITKEFPGIKANDDITLQLRKGEVHALLGENGAGKSTLMSVLFGLYQPEEGKILKNGKEVAIRNPNDANALGIGMVHQHFKLVECFSVLDNIILGVEPNKLGFLQKAEARKKVVALSEKYGLRVDPDALIMIFTVNVKLALCMVAVLPFTALCTYFQSKDVYPAFQRNRDCFSSLNAFVQENVSGNRVVKAFASEQYEIERGGVYNRS